MVKRLKFGSVNTTAFFQEKHFISKIGQKNSAIFV